MLYPRIIPCLLIKNKGLVKTVKFSAPKYVGDPINAVRIFNEKEVDELVVLDIDATSNNVEPNYRLIKLLAAECRMPLCYGGGIHNVEQAKKIISLGVEKVALSSAVLERPELIKEIANEIGNQSVVVILDVKKRVLSKKYDIWTHNGTKKTSVSIDELVAQLESYGAGEVVINSIDNDGVMKGYDIPLATAVRKLTKLPMTILGGVGTISDIGELIQKFGIVGAAAGSLFVFKGKYKAVLINYPSAKEKNNLIKKYTKHKSV